MDKPSKPSPDFPLYAHRTKRWAKKIAGKTEYFGPWDDPQGSLERYLNRDKPQNLPPDEARAKPAVLKPPRPDGYPLYAHSSGRWAKKIRGKIRYFGKWDEPQVALDKWLEEKDALLAGRVPRANKDGLTVLGLVNHFLSNKEQRVATGELKKRTFKDYKLIADRLVKVFGKKRLVEDLQPNDFELLRADFSATHGPVALFCDITRAKTIFAHGDETFHVRPDYGASFNKPTKSNLRREKTGRAKKFFEAGEIVAMLNVASVPLKAMILLGINCAFGNDDCATICVKHLDLEGGWHNYPRPKTSIVRRCPLWPETVEALEAAIAARRKARDPQHADRVFLTAHGNTWERGEEDGPISKEMSKLMKGLNLHKNGRNFYSLRHTFYTVAQSSGQSSAASFIMGHAPSNEDMAAFYLEDTFDNTLLTVSNFIRSWLHNSPSHPATKSPDKSAGD
jgi:integrase